MKLLTFHSEQRCAEHVASRALIQVLLLSTAPKFSIKPGRAYCEAAPSDACADVCLWLSLAGFAWASKGAPISVCLDKNEDHLLPAAGIIKRNPNLRFHIFFEPFAILPPEALINYTVELLWEVLEAYEETVLVLAEMARKWEVVGRKTVLDVVTSRKPTPGSMLWRPEVADMLENARSRSD